MIDGSPVSLQSSNLSLAWGKAFSYVLDTPESRLQPSIVTISGFPGAMPEEVSRVKSAVDSKLKECRVPLSCEKIAFTIFPRNYWNRKAPASELFEHYEKAYVRLLARARKLNSHWGHGTYFHRMIAPGGNYGKNQLAHVIERWNAGVHHGMIMQISCREPAIDQNNNPRPSFPCLQQVGLSFRHDRAGNTLLWLNAFYPLQDVVERAYGNYLGLCRLGEFLAHYMDGCQFSGLNCFVGKPTLGGATKRSLSTLRGELDKASAPDVAATNGAAE